MFDIGFWELTIIGIVALLVIGPERLPRVARTAGLWVGRARRFVSSVKADIDREIAADELKKALGKQAETPGIYDIIEDTKKSLQDIQESATEQPHKQQIPESDTEQPHSDKQQIPESVTAQPHSDEPETPKTVTGQPHDDKDAVIQKSHDASG